MPFFQSQNYDGEIVDDYVTGVEQVGVEPTAAVETAVSVDTQKMVDPPTEVTEFKEYDVKNYDNKGYGEGQYDYDYGDYTPTHAKPTTGTYEEEFGPGVPGFRESVSAADFRNNWGRGGYRNVKACGRCCWCHLMGVCCFH